MVDLLDLSLIELVTERNNPILPLFIELITVLVCYCPKLKNGILSGGIGLKITQQATIKTLAQEKVGRSSPKLIELLIKLYTESMTIRIQIIKLKVLTPGGKKILML